jgi:hypothetical protein
LNGTREKTGTIWAMSDFVASHWGGLPNTEHRKIGSSSMETLMNRRTLIGAAAAVAAFPALNRVASAQTSPKTKNVVFVHGLFADGSCWSKVIARLQQKGINCTSAQNP